MILSIVLSCFILIKAHELVAPGSDRRENNEVPVMQLLELYSESHGVVHTLPDQAFSATDFDNDNFASHVRIGSATYWEGKSGATNAITVDMTTFFLVTGVATEGYTWNKYVQKYSVMTSKDGITWKAHGIFVANFDAKTICKIQFDRPVFARFVKVTVVKYANCPCMRLDVLVYDKDRYH